MMKIRLKQLILIISLATTLSAYEITIDKTLKIKEQKNNSGYKYPPLIRDDRKQTVYDPSLHLIWQDNSEAKSVKRDWEGAKRYCKDLNFSGYNDWRLPTIKELETIVYYSRYPDAYKKGFKNFTSSSYWSSSPSISVSSGAWSVNFNYGDSSYYYEYDKLYVRCTREGQ